MKIMVFLESLDSLVKSLLFYSFTILLFGDTVQGSFVGGN